MWCRWRSKARSSGTMVGVYDLQAPAGVQRTPAVPAPAVTSAQALGHRFVVQCEPHGQATHVAGLDAAWRTMPTPSAWCTACAAGGPAVAPTAAPGTPAPKPAKAPKLAATSQATVERIARNLATATAAKPKAARLDEAANWQAWALKLADQAPANSTVMWLGDFKYSVTLGHNGCSVEVRVHPTNGTAKYVVTEECKDKGTPGQYATFEDALEATGYVKPAAAPAKRGKAK